jgi:gluconate kinase
VPAPAHREKPRIEVVFTSPLSEWEFRKNLGYMDYRSVDLDDYKDRESWIDTLHQVVQKHAINGSSMILTCSALKKKYRRQLDTLEEPEAGLTVDIAGTTKEISQTIVDKLLS